MGLNYFVFQLSQTGHLIDDICEHGFNQLYCLAVSGHYDHVMECLISLTPLFAEEDSGDGTVHEGNTNMLISSSDFMKAIENIVNADQTYFKMAKDLIVTDFPGPVLREFGNMLAKQISNYTWYGLGSACSLISLWLNVFVSIPQWNNTKTTLYVVDFLCNYALRLQQDNSTSCCQQASNKVFSACLRDLTEKTKNTNHRGFFAWMSGNDKSGNVSASLISPSCATEFSNFAFCALEAEEQMESNIEMWHSVLDALGEQQISNQADNGAEQAVSRAAKQLGKATPPLFTFPIHKWSQFILDAPIDHPMQVAFAQKFFQHYFAKSRPSNPMQEGECVGAKFFVGMFYSLHLNKVKVKLKAIADFYADPTLSSIGAETEVGSTKTDSHYLAESSDFDQQMKLFTAYHMWLEDNSTITSPTLHVPSLPPCFRPELLEKILSGEKSLWIHYIATGDLHKRIRKGAADWDRLHFRGLPSRSSSEANERKRRRDRATRDSNSPEHRIVKRLKSHDSPLPLPSKRNLGCSRSSSLPSTPNSSSGNCEVILLEESKLKTCLDGSINTISKYAQTFNVDTLEYNAVLCSFLEQAPALYINSQVEVITTESCTGTTGPKGEKFACAGTATIVHKFKQARKQEVVEHKIEVNRKAIQAVADRLTEAIPYRLAQVVTLLEDMTNLAIVGYQIQETSERKSYLQAALTIFYTLLDGLNDEMSACPPVRNLISRLLEQLGQEMLIQEPEQCLPLLDRLVKRPKLAQYVSQFFMPSVESGVDFTIMYKKIGDIPKSEASLAFVLLSKMDVEGWIHHLPPPSLMEKSRLISQLGKLLRKTGEVVRNIEHSDASEDIVMLHGIFRRHLSLLSVSNFPEHFGEVIGLLLILTEAQALDPSVWYDIINATLAAAKLSTQRYARV